MKLHHGFAIAAIRSLHGLAHGAKHNAAKRNMIAWRRCVSMLDAQMPSKALSAEVVPRCDAAERYLRRLPVVSGGAGADQIDEPRAIRLSEYQRNACCLLEQWRKITLQHSVLDPANRTHVQKTRQPIGWAPHGQWRVSRQSS